MPAVASVITRSNVHEVNISGPYSTPAGTTKNIGSPADLPVRRLVRLHDQPTGRLLRDLWSDPVTGAYQFDYLRAGRFFVIAFDHTGQYNGEVVTGISLPTPPAP